MRRTTPQNGTSYYLIEAKEVARVVYHTYSSIVKELEKNVRERKKEKEKWLHFRHPLLVYRQTRVRRLDPRN